MARPVAPEFRRLFDADYRAAVAVAGRITGEPEVGERVVRHVFVRAHAAWWRARRSPSRWVMRRVIALSIEVAESVGGNESPRVEPPLVDAPVRHRHLAAALDSLTRRERHVVVMRYLGGWSVPDVASRLGLDEEHVRAVAAAGLAALREELQDQGERAAKERSRRR